MTARAFDPILVEDIVALHADRPGPTLPILHAVQEAFGFVPPESLPIIARGLNLSRAEVHGVVSFYHHFRDAPTGRTVIEVCRAEACQARGAAALIAHAEKALGCAMHQTRADRAVTLAPVYCLGHCATGPNMQIGERLYGRVDVAKFDRIAARVLHDPRSI